MIRILCTLLVLLLFCPNSYAKANNNSRHLALEKFVIKQFESICVNYVGDFAAIRDHAAELGFDEIDDKAVLKATGAVRKWSIPYQQSESTVLLSINKNSCWISAYSERGKNSPDPIHQYIVDKQGQLIEKNATTISLINSYSVNLNGRHSKIIYEYGSMPFKSSGKLAKIKHARIMALRITHE